MEIQNSIECSVGFVSGIMEFNLNGSAENSYKYSSAILWRIWSYL